MGGLTDVERRAFTQLEQALREGKGALMQVTINGAPRAAIASYETVEGKGRLAVYGLLLTVEERDAISRSMEQLTTVSTAPGPLEPAPVPFPDQTELNDYLRADDPEMTLADQLEASNQDMANADANPDNMHSVEYVNRKDGRRYGAVSMLQLFDLGPDDTWAHGDCPFCAGELTEHNGKWSCSRCGCSWTEPDGSYAPGNKEAH